MYVVFGLTSGMSSMIFEGRYKGPSDIRDVHVSDVPRTNHVLRSFVITDDKDALIIWSFDIPGYETHIYSMIKERATLLLCPRIDNSTYLLPDVSLVEELSSMLYKDARSVTYFVKPINRSFVSSVLRATVGAARALVMEKVDNLLKSRGLATVRLMDELGTISEDITLSANKWVERGFANEVGDVYSLTDYIRNSLELKKSRSRKRAS